MLSLTNIKAVFRRAPSAEIKPVQTQTVTISPPRVLTQPSAIIVTPPNHPPAFDGVPVGQCPEFLWCLPCPADESWNSFPPNPAPPLGPISKRHAINGFSTIAATATDIVDIVRYHEIRREELWEGAKETTSFLDGLTIVVPGSSTTIKEFMFGKKMRSWSMYNRMVKQIQNDSGRTSLEPIVLLSRTYPKAIYDPTSYHAWLEWVEGHEAKDRVLLAI